MVKLAAVMVALSGCIVSTGAVPLHDGARVQFAQDAVCPIDDVAVQPRADIPAHMLVAPPQQPPADVSADPQRLIAWRTAEVDRETALDASYRSYEATGCGRDVLYVCAHPTQADVQTEADRIIGSTDVRSGDVFTSAVKCMPATAGVSTAAL